MYLHSPQQLGLSLASEATGQRHIDQFIALKACVLDGSSRRAQAARRPNMCPATPAELRPVGADV